MTINVAKHLDERGISFETGDTFVLLATTAKELAQKITLLEDDAFTKVYNDCVCSYKMGNPICEQLEAEDYGVYLFQDMDDAQCAVEEHACNIHEAAAPFTLFCHKHNTHILMELTEGAGSGLGT